MKQPRKDAAIILADRRRLAYAEYGDPDGFPVFLFHGLPGSRLSWGLLPDNPFPSGLRLIALDRPGYGRSDPRPHRTHLEWANDVAELADALAIDHFAMVGVSGGGPGALACAWKMPDRITSLNIVASPAPTNAPGVFEGMSKTNRFFMRLAWNLPWLSSLNARLLAAIIRRNPGRYINTMQVKVHDVDKAIIARPEIQQMLVADFSEALNQGAQGMIDDLSANHGQLWGFPLDDIKTKVTFWYCELDRSVPLAMGRYLSEAVPNSELRVIKDAGHLWVLENIHDVLKETARTESLDT